MLVREILRLKGSAVFSVTPDQPLAEAISTIVEHDLGSLVVLEESQLCGLLTFREALKAVSLRGGDVRGVSVRDVMIATPETVGPDVEANVLRRTLVESHQRYVPVLDDGNLVGVLSFMDVAKAVLEEQSFENAMLKNFIKNWPEEADNAKV